MSFMWWFLLNAPQLARIIIQSFIELGSLASSNISVYVEEDQVILTAGVTVAFRLLQDTKDMLIETSWVNIFWAIIPALLSLAAAFTLAYISIQMALVYITGWIFAYAGIVVLGLAGLRWTSGVTLVYFKTVIGIGLQLMTMMLIQGLGLKFISETIDLRLNKYSFEDSFLVLLLSVFLLVLTRHIPPLVVGLISPPFLSPNPEAIKAGYLRDPVILAAASLPAKTAAAIKENRERQRKYKEKQDELAKAATPRK